MPLEDYALPGVDVADLVEPFRSRVLSICEFFGGRLRIESAYRSFAQQVALWNLYGPPRAARPGTSNHERGGAVDFDLADGLTWVKVHAEAPNHGLMFPLDYEDWHCEADPTWHPTIPPEEDDMLTKEMLADWLGATIAPEGDDFAGKICVPLVVIKDGQVTGTKLYPFGAAASYTHQEMAYQRNHIG